MELQSAVIDKDTLSEATVHTGRGGVRYMNLYSVCVVSPRQTAIYVMYPTAHDI